jgi:hypothetical protein
MHLPTPNCRRHRNPRQRKAHGEPCEFQTSAKGWHLQRQPVLRRLGRRGAGGHFLKPKAFSGATDCDGIRKTMKYEPSASPFVLQTSGAKDDSVSVAVLPSE